MRTETLPSRRLFLQPGEIVPVICFCGTIYVPSEGSETSVCPVCSRDHHHLFIEREISLKRRVRVL